jgi:hypothetical protein
MSYGSLQTERLVQRHHRRIQGPQPKNYGAVVSHYTQDKGPSLSKSRVEML